MITISAVLKNSFRNKNLLLLLVLCAGLQGCSNQAGADAPGNEQTSEIIFHLHSGQQHRFEEISSPFVLMNYWASWCKPCVKEIPELNRLNDHANLSVYAFNFDRLEGSQLLAEAEKFQLRLPMMLNEPAPLFAERSPAALPATLVVNTQTGEKKWLMGAQTEQKILAELGLN